MGLKVIPKYLYWLSTSHDGLQCKLNKLQAFCDDWGIDVNVSKTKAIIFNKTGF
jgi:hypothetical protein